MRHFLSVFCAFTLMMGAMPALAEPSCKPTAAVPAQNYPNPRDIPSGNNLLKPAGKALEADGQKITIYGRVLDNRCAPVPQAVVELWQNSPFGRWLLAGKEDLATSRAIFAGAGRTYTNTDGSFAFVTAFPAPLGNRAPFVNIKITADKMPTLTSALYFSDDSRNGNDDLYRKMVGTAGDSVIKMQQTEDGELVGTIDIVLPAKMPFSEY